MSNSWFQFKKFKINQDKTAMKVGVDGVLIGAAARFGISKTVLDIGAGTGLLSFMAAQRTDAHITALEIEKNAFDQCSENVRLNNLENRIHVLHTSFQGYYKNNRSKFDFIISNPPFFEKSLKSKYENRNIARHSDILSKRELVKGSSILLKPAGVFTLILPIGFEKPFDRLCREQGLFCSYKLIIKPKENKPANRIIAEYSYVKKKLFTDMLIVRDNNSNQYTKAYKKLTKDFYLHF
jgi:tRNA1Val (adenine37-N6)-methyltransferase